MSRRADRPPVAAQDLRALVETVASYPAPTAEALRSLEVFGDHSPECTAHLLAVHLANGRTTPPT